MAYTYEPTDTDKTLAEMLTEPTGRHFLDSGGAYGREWQRQQGRAVADFLAEPEITIEGHDADYGSITLSVFHFLRKRLEYLHVPTLALLRLGETESRKDDPWLVTIEEWAKRKHESCDYEDYWPRETFNSYNHDNNLSQTIQFSAYTDRIHGRCIALQIHGGADVRGGYTAPKVFQVTSDEPHDLFDWERYTIACTVQGGEHQVTELRDASPQIPGLETSAWLDVHAWDKGSGGDWVEYGGSYTGNPWGDTGAHPMFTETEDGWQLTCPRCGEPAEIFAPGTW